LETFASEVFIYSTYKLMLYMHDVYYYTLSSIVVMRMEGEGYRRTSHLFT